MVTRDGVRLDADIYRPLIKKPLPILLMRQPYGRSIASTVVYAHPTWYASQGYIVVIQDVRGRGTSEGKFELFTNEITDGLDTLNWLSELPGSTGEIGMYGFSYQGMTQLYCTVHKHPSLKAIAPAMVGYDLYSDWGYENNAFCLQYNLAWAIQLATETARLEKNEIAYQKLYNASLNLPLNDSIPSRPDIMQELAEDSFYHKWLENFLPGEYWEKLSPKYLLKDINLPMLHIGGWFDPYLRGTLNLYREMVKNNKQPQHLIIGAWGHLPWGRKLGQVDYGMESQNPIDEIQIRWFDYFLKGKDTGILNEDPIRLFEIGSNKWKSFKTFPQGVSNLYYLASDGLASIREDSGILWEYLEESSNDTSQELEEKTATEFTNTVDTIVHDPWRPVPSNGGHSSFPGGQRERTELDCRSDILTYTSFPLEKDLHLIGKIIVSVYCKADKPSFDISAILSQVSKEGKVINITQGYIRLDSPELPIQIPLQETFIKIDSGNNLRLSLSCSCFPAYPVNPGTGKLPHQSRSIDNQIITLQVFSGEKYPSLIKLNSLVESNLITQ